jgi:HSP20 family protein
MRNLMIRPSRFGLASDLDHLFGGLLRTPVWNCGDTCFVPPTDVEETDKDYRLTFELPGMDKKNIKVTVEDQMLTVSGERKVRSEDKNDGYLRTEIQSGSFSRSFTLPATVDRQNITADYKDGLLVVTLSKVEEAKPKQIEVKIK